MPTKLIKKILKQNTFKLTKKISIASLIVLKKNNEINALDI